MPTEIISQESEQNILESAKKGMALLEEANRLADAIKDDTTFSEAGHFRVALSREKKSREELLEPTRKKTYDAYQEVLKLIKTAISPFEQALKIVDLSIGKYADAQEQIRFQEQERQRKEAQRQADEAQMAAAMEAQDSGDHARAEAIIEKPVVVATPKAAPMAKVQGMGTRDNWKVDALVNVRLLAQAIVKGEASVELLVPNYPALNRMAKALKESMKVPGVTVIREKTVASTRG